MRYPEDISDATTELANAAKDVARSARSMASRIAQQTEGGLPDSTLARPMIWGALTASAALLGLIVYRQRAARLWTTMEQAVEQTIPARMRRGMRMATAEAPVRGRKRKAHRRRTQARRRTARAPAQPSQAIH